MGARVDFLEPEARLAGAPVATTVPRIRVPAAVVHEEGGHSIVWVVRDGRLDSRTIEAGPVSGGFREIRSGLAGGELLLSGGVDAPRAGMRVQVSKQ
jgi:multidrug efflux pump subunit AcrA (membrane-fusion protein)